MNDEHQVERLVAALGPLNWLYKCAHRLRERLAVHPLERPVQSVASLLEHPVGVAEIAVARLERLALLKNLTVGAHRVGGESEREHLLADLHELVDALIGLVLRVVIRETVVPLFHELQYD